MATARSLKAKTLKVARHSSSSTSGQETEVARLTRELHEALEQRTASSEILRIISGSPADVQRVFDTIVASAVRLCGARMGAVYRFDGELLHLVAHYNYSPEVLEVLHRTHPRSPQSDQASGRAIVTRTIVQIEDTLADPNYLYEIAHASNWRSILAVPMLREGLPIGAIVITRNEPGPFAVGHIELVKNFGAQAVIAIENTRLLNELRHRTDDLSESLEQQTATSEVLKVISSSPSDTQPVFDMIAKSVARLCKAQFCHVFRFDGKLIHFEAVHGYAPEVAAVSRAMYPMAPGRGSAAARSILSGAVEEIPDILADHDYAHGDQAKIMNFRSIVAVPMIKDDRPMGAIAIARSHTGHFPERQIDLLRSFADQAVIAIENTRLFEAEQERTRELSESLQQQTATADVLKVISRSTFDLQTVLDTLVESAARLCGADMANLLRPKGDVFQFAASYGHEWKYREHKDINAIPVARGSVAGRTLLEGKTVQIPDVFTDPEYKLTESAKIAGFRTTLGVPLLREGTPIGVITLQRRTVQPFTDKQIELAETFADQAVIAIENVRLFDEVQTRTSELSQSVEELRALGEVSQAINSTLDVETVLTTIVAKAVQLSGTEAGTIYTFDESRQEFRLRATYGMDDAIIAEIKDQYIQLGDTILGRTAARRMSIQIADVQKDPSATLDVILRAGFRALLTVPLLSADRIVGALIVRRKAPGEFPRGTVELLQTLADQSVLTIQNARLFREIEDKSRQLEIASQHKSQFLANMSHELRTPLNAILGYTELMADGAYGEPSEKMLGILQRLGANGKHLLGLINDVLDLSKIEAGQLVLELSDYSVQDIAQTVRSSLEPLAADKKLGFKVEITPHLPSGHGDGRRLTQVLINLVGNAIKFTDAGEVAIKAEANNGSFHVSVRDTGPGISAADQAKLFQEFQQADNAITKKKGGTGLGLAISKRIIEMHGGRIWVESQPGQGSTFTFTLPVVVEHQVEAA